MLIDPFGRPINYLRISVTDKCNYRCVYCMPSSGISLKPHKEMLSYEAIALIAHHANKLGVKKIRITGGEPLVKRNIEYLIEMLRLAGDFEDIAMTTNGSLLTPELAAKLKTAGLRRINISLDTLDPKRFSQLTRGGNLEKVLAGMDAALQANLRPVKINMLIFPETTPDEIDEIRSFCEKKGLILQTIQQFSLYERDEIQYSLSLDRPPKCDSCNRLRLTADGYLKPCLFSNKEIKVDLNNIEESIHQAIRNKPVRGIACNNRTMCQIGG